MQLRIDLDFFHRARALRALSRRWLRIRIAGVATRGVRGAGDEVASPPDLQAQSRPTERAGAPERGRRCLSDRLRAQMFDELLVQPQTAGFRLVLSLQVVAGDEIGGQHAVDDRLDALAVVEIALPRGGE